MKPSDAERLKVEKIADKARESISKYCFTECKAYCCRKGYLPMTKKQAELVAGKRKDELLKKDILTKTDWDTYVLDLWGEDEGCPSLDKKDFKCTIHKESGRPSACKEFPIFIWEEKTIRISRRCPAVKEDLLYPYLAKLKLKGYKLTFGSENADNDFMKSLAIR